MTTQTGLGKTATTVKTKNGYTYVTYHSTDVVIFNERFIELNTGGWNTVTTKGRMNQASNQFELGYKVFQKNYDWFITYQGKTYEYDNTRALINRETGAVYVGQYISEQA